MSRYQVSSMGLYCKLLCEDALHAIDHEVRIDGNDPEWVKDADLDPKQEVKDVIQEISHQLFMMLAASNVMEQLSGYEVKNGKDLMEYGAATEEWKQAHYPDWEWVYEDDEEE